MINEPTNMTSSTFSRGRWWPNAGPGT